MSSVQVSSLGSGHHPPTQPLGGCICYHERLSTTETTNDNSKKKVIVRHGLHCGSVPPRLFLQSCFHSCKAAHSHMHVLSGAPHSDRRPQRWLDDTASHRSTIGEAAQPRASEPSLWSSRMLSSPGPWPASC